MCPYHAKVSEDLIIERAREIIASAGVERLSLHQLAADLGIKAPSLYRYFANKNLLLRAVNTQTIRDLVQTVMAAQLSDVPPRQQIIAMMLAYHAYALANPALYVLAYAPLDSEARPDDAELEQLALPLQAAVALITGQAASLAALRGIWALIHGFAMLEINAQFRRGGDVKVALHQAVEAMVTGWDDLKHGR
jgi:AcrR family transcriptional regulator